METAYFIIVNGKQAGPFPVEELKYHHLTPDTYVWREGLPNWAKASTVPELEFLFLPPACEPVQPQVQTPPQFHTTAPGCAPQCEDRAPKVHTDWTTWAIVAIVVNACTGSCLGLVLGIIGLVQANKANTFYSTGSNEMGDACNSTARICTIISLALLAVGVLALIFLISTGIFTSLFAFI